MLTDDQTPASTDAFKAAKRNWECLTQRDESAITMRSIFVTVRLAIRNLNGDEDEITDVQWLLRMGEYLADIGTYRPELA